MLIEEYPYKSWKNEDKSDLLTQGRPTSDLTCLFIDKNVL